MRLVKAVQRLEAAGAAVAVETTPPVGICWTRHEVRIDAAGLADGEYIAADVRMMGDCQDGQGSLWWEITERLTRDAQDLGCVVNAAGEAVGVVVGIRPGLLTWRRESCGSCADAGECADAV